MKQRCYNPNNSSYRNYGLRGIIICPQWKNDFSEFYRWSIQNGYAEGLTIDRVNVDGNYEPNNCRWVSRQIQANNTRSNIYITLNNMTKTLSDWCRYFNANYSCAHERYKKGIAPELLFS